MEIRNAIDELLSNILLKREQIKVACGSKWKLSTGVAAKKNEILQHNSTLCIHHLRNRVNDSVEIPSTRNQWRVLYVELANLEHN